MTDFDWQKVWCRLQAIVGFFIVDETSGVGNDFVKTHPARPPEKEGKMHVRRMWPFGIRSRPPAGTPSITVGPMGSTTQKVMIAAESEAYGPTDLADGETVIYCKTNGTTIKLDANGKITINAATGQDVVVNGGSQPVARKNDPAGYIVVTTVMGVITAVTWSPTAVVGAGVVSTPIFIQDGAPNFKG